MSRLTSLIFLIFLGCSASYGNTEPDGALQKLLVRASKLEQLNPWESAVIYCKIARNGSLEAYYRLGMLFAFGQGVPENREIAASLFATAAQQGHSEAGKMLETILYSADRLPDCVLSDKKPPRARFYSRWANDASLDAILASLRKDHRWIINMVKQIASWHQVDPKLALSIVSVESAFQINARSKANAMGLMQLIPSTAARFNVRNAFDASQNIKGGVRYLRWLLDRYHGDIELVAAAYNAGEGAVDKYKGIPPYPETQDYVSKVIHRYQSRKHAFNLDKF
jgi:soluble lytic murein transglycosylase-like protein